jgi:hypothetical protein
MHPYSEKLVRYSAINDEGKPCEILERVTYERQQDGAEAVVVNRRYDLRTGECLKRLNEDEFEEVESGARVTLQR